MTRYDSEYDTSTDSGVAEAAEGASRLVERNVLAIKMAVFYAVSFGATYAVYRFVEGPNAPEIVAIGMWFIVIFAVLTALFGGVVKVLDAIQRRRHSFE